MIPWMRIHGNPLALLPIIGVLVAAGVVYARIFTRGELGTGRDLGHLLIVLVLLQTTLVLDLVLQFAVTRRRIAPNELNPSAERALRVTRRLLWALLVIPAVSIVLMIYWPPTPQTLFNPRFTLAWVLPLLNNFPITAGYLLLAVINSARTGQAEPDGAPSADSPAPTPDLEAQRQ
jgi:hypothetical protein